MHATMNSPLKHTRYVLVYVLALHVRLVDVLLGRGLIRIVETLVLPLLLLRRRQKYPSSSSTHVHVYDALELLNCSLVSGLPLTRSATKSHLTTQA